MRSARVNLSIVISLFLFLSAPVWAAGAEAHPCIQALEKPAKTAAAQAQWKAETLKAIEALSHHIALQGLYKEPVMLLTRGNSGSGKSWILANGDHKVIQRLNLKSYFAAAGEAGINNPDSLKALIQKRDGSSSQEAHEEGSALSKEIVSAAIKQRLNVIVDKRFLTVDSISSTIKEAKRLGYRVIVLDVDADLDTSILRIGSREVGGSSPSVPFQPIAEGFIEARAHRTAIAQHEQIDEYYLFGNGRLVAERQGLNFKIHDSTSWSSLTQKPDERSVSVSENLYASLLDFLSQTVSADVLRPYHVGLTSSLKISSGPAEFRSHPEQNAVEYLYYQIYKTGDSQSHEKMGYYLKQFFSRVYPQVELRSEFVPEQPNRSADYRLLLTTTDADLARRLLHDGFWNPTLTENSDGRSLTLTYSTRRIGVRPSYIPYIDYDDVQAFLPGETAPDMGLAAKHFIISGSKLGKLKNGPPNVEIEIRANIRFTTPFASAHHSRGFHVRQLTAALFAAQVEHYQLKKGLSQKDKVCELLKEANQYAAVTQGALQNIPGLLLKAQPEQIAPLKTWIEKMINVASDVAQSAGCESWHQSRSAKGNVANSN